MTHKNHLKHIISSICRLDIETLRHLINDVESLDLRYKEFFLTEMEDIFYTYKQSGDTELAIYNGKCAGADCENCGMTGYRFVGNISRNYFDIVFEMNGVSIVDILACDKLKTDEVVENLGSKADPDIFLNPYNTGEGKGIPF